MLQFTICVVPTHFSWSVDLDINRSIHEAQFKSVGLWSQHVNINIRQLHCTKSWGQHPDLESFVAHYVKYDCNWDSAGKEFKEGKGLKFTFLFTSENSSSQASRLVWKTSTGLNQSKLGLVRTKWTLTEGFHQLIPSSIRQQSRKH